MKTLIAYTFLMAGIFCFHPMVKTAGVSDWLIYGAAFHCALIAMTQRYRLAAGPSWGGALYGAMGPISAFYVVTAWAAPTWAGMAILAVSFLMALAEIGKNRTDTRRTILHKLN